MGNYESKCASCHHACREHDNSGTQVMVAAMPMLMWITLYIKHKLGGHCRSRCPDCGHFRHEAFDCAGTIKEQVFIPTGNWVALRQGLWKWRFERQHTKVMQGRRCYCNVFHRLRTDAPVESVCV